MSCTERALLPAAALGLACTCRRRAACPANCRPAGHPHRPSQSGAVNARGPGGPFPLSPDPAPACRPPIGRRSAGVPGLRTSQPGPASPRTSRRSPIGHQWTGALLCALGGRRGGPRSAPRDGRQASGYWDGVVGLRRRAAATACRRCPALDPMHAPGPRPSSTRALCRSATAAAAGSHGVRHAEPHPGEDRLARQGLPVGRRLGLLCRCRRLASPRLAACAVARIAG